MAEEVFKKVIDVSDEPIMTMASFNRKPKPVVPVLSGNIDDPERKSLTKKPSFDEDRYNQNFALCISLQGFYAITELIKSRKSYLEEFCPKDRASQATMPYRIEKFDIIMKKINQLDSPAILNEFKELGDPKLNYLLLYRLDASCRTYEKYLGRKKIMDYNQLVNYLYSSKSRL